MTVIIVPSPSETVVAQIIDADTAEVIYTETVVVTTPPTVTVVEVGVTGGGSSGLRGVAVVTTSGTLSTDTELALVNASAGPVMVTLPSAASAALLTVTIKKTDGSANAVTIAGTGTEFTVTLTQQFMALTVASDGTVWWILSGWGQGTTPTIFGGPNFSTAANSAWLAII